MLSETTQGVEQIGATAGLVWQMLADKGPATATKIIREVAAPRDITMQALGWLARENKIVIEESSRSRLYSLRQ